MPAEGVVDTQVQDGQKPDANTPANGQPTDQQKPQQRTNPDPKPGNKDGDDARVRGLTTDLQGERAARKKLERQIAELTGNLTAEQKRVRALAGVEPRSEDEAEAEEIIARLKTVVPGIELLLDENKRTSLDKILAMLPQLERTQQHYWGRHGMASLKAIEGKISETFGDLSDRQVKKVRAAFVTEAETNPEFAKRYEEDPEGLIEEFAKEWVEDWFEPSKRKVTADEVSRQRKVPGARERTFVAPDTQKPIDVTDDKAVGDVLVAGFRARGNEFGRRS